MSIDGGGGGGCDPIRAGGADEDGGGSGEPLISVAIWPLSLPAERTDNEFKSNPPPGL